MHPVAWVLVGFTGANTIREEDEAGQDQHESETLDDPSDCVSHDFPPAVRFSVMIFVA
jgi:hypothetical protein